MKPPSERSRVELWTHADPRIQPADPGRVVVTGVRAQLGVERRGDPVDEPLVPGPWEGPVAEQQQPVVMLPGTDQPPVTPQEVGGVVGDEGPPLTVSVLEHREVVTTAQVPELGLLQGHDVVSPSPQFGRHGRRDQVVQQQPHPSNDRSTS